MSSTEITQAMIDAARKAARAVGFTPPFAARSRDYDNLSDLQMADLAAEHQNDQAMREVIQAALEAQ